jgi:hypothetical protein
VADYFTHFSCVLDAGCPEKAARALDLHARLRAQDEASGDPEHGGFALTLQDGPGTSVLWFHDDGQGDVEGLIAFVLRLAAEIDLKGLWGFSYALTCSRPRLEAFGGGAHVVDLGARKNIGWVSTDEWLAEALVGEDPDA